MAKVENKYKPAKNEALLALDDIRGKYRKLLSTYIEKFAPVYYPIAIVEMNLDEMSFENFESVQYSILKLVALGIKKDNVIADTLGLSLNYVEKVLRLLKGYGHIGSNGITELGLKSVNTGQKIVKSQVWQKFQVDALNGTLLKVDQTITESMLNDRGQTDITIGHLNYLDGMSVREISTQLAKNNISKYIYQKSGIINTNVTRINDIRCTEVKYARCYLMKIRNCNEPIVFAKRYDRSKKDVKERFSWQPFSVKNKEIIEKYGFESDLPINSEVCTNYVGKLYTMLLERGEAKVDLEKQIPYAISKVYRFDEEGLETPQIEGRVVPTINIDERAFKVYRTWIINLLIGLQNDGEYLITNEKLFGNIISLRTDSQLLHDVSDVLADKIGKYGKGDVIKHIKGKFRDYEGPGLIEEIFEELKKI